MLLLVFIAGAIGTSWHVYWRADELYQNMALQGTTLQVITLKEFRRLYSEEVLNSARRRGIDVGHGTGGDGPTFPLPATLTMELGRRLNEHRPGAHVRLYSNYPFPQRKGGGARDDFEREALRVLEKQPDQPFFRFEAFEGRPSLRYAVADRMQASCVACHNNHRESPKTDWRVGDMRGVLEVIRPLDEQVAVEHAAQRRGILLSVTVAGLGLAGLCLVYRRLRRTAVALASGAIRTRAILESALDCIIAIDHEGRVLEFNPAAERTFGYSRADVIGQLMSELIIPPSLREAYRRGVARFLTTGEDSILGHRIEITAQRADGTELPVELAISVIQNAGPPTFTAYLRDLTGQKQAAAALAERMRLATLTAEVATALNQGASLQEMLRRCAECLVEHLDAAFARIWTLDQRGDVLELQASAGMYTHLDGPHSRVPVGQFKIGLIAQERQPHLTNVVIGDPRVGDQGWARREGMVAFAGYPLLVDDHLVGVMALFARQPLSGSALQAMASVANGIALAIERHWAGEQMAHQATHDALTGLPNRTLHQQNLERNVASARENEASFALLLIDLDRFKEINDTFGHHYGDMVLQELNPRLRAALRNSDLVARLGGDEFGAILPGADEAGAVLAAEKILEGLKPPMVVDGNELEVGASIGIAVYPEHGEDAITLMQRADVAMYAAKRIHGGSAVYSPDQSGNSPRRLALIRELRHGIENNQLLLHYQPKIDLRTMRVSSAEALVRWLHPREGMILPGQFIPLAEHTGLIKPLGLWTLHTTFLQCRVWHQAGMNLNIAINLAPENLQDPRLIGSILKVLEDSDALPSWLTVEITEGAMMADPTGTREVLRRLHDLGVRISIDDFGTGYSSLAYLKTLPVDEVKIDRGFVKDMIGSDKDACIVRSVIDLGHNLGLQVVAEGVEDRSSLDLLVLWGCDFAQGYYFSRPLPPKDFMKWKAKFTGEHPGFPKTNGSDPRKNGDIAIPCRDLRKSEKMLPK